MKASSVADGAFAWAEKATKKVGFMLTLSKKVEYGLIAMLHMASKPAAELATAKDISEQFAIPCELLGKVLQSLARAGLVEAVLGAHGGYRLRKPIEQLTLGHVIEALEGPVHLARCQEDPQQCGQYHACNIKEPVFAINDRLMTFINGISLGTFRRSDRHEPVLMEL